jgi:MYXO-CTERM domain-containing protein
MSFLSPLLSSVAGLLLWIGGQFTFQYSPQTDKAGTAQVEVHADSNLSGVKVQLIGDNGQRVEKRVSVKAGKPTLIKWKQKDREVEYQLTIEADEAYTEATITIRRPVAGGKQGQFTMLSDRTEIVDKRQIPYKTPFTLSSQTFQVFATEGTMVVDELVTDQVVEAGATVTKNWCATEEVFMIKFRGEDDIGANATDTRVPWSVHIPHTEVQFDSGKAIIKPDQAPKVDEAYAVLAHELAGLERANQAVGANLAAQLYIIGYTDTVGNASDNQKLSEGRAKAIAKYFKNKGAWCEIYYAGMGERGLAVQTGDSVDNQANRRALYLLGVQKPAGGGQIPGPGKWKKLTDASARPPGELPELPESYHVYKEKVRQERLAKYSGSCEGPGGGSGGGSPVGGDDEPSDSSSGVSSGGDGDGSGGEPYLGEAGGPPSVDGEPGASGKGCSTAGDAQGPAQAAGLLALFGLGALARRRR